MNPIQQTDIDFFRSVLGEKFVLVDAESLTNNAHDQTEDLQFFPEVVLRPGNPYEITSSASGITSRIVFLKDWSVDR